MVTDSYDKDLKKNITNNKEESSSPFQNDSLCIGCWTSPIPFLIWAIFLSSRVLLILNEVDYKWLLIWIFP